jgi:N-acetylmuramoyl-L-alanine amidase
MKWKPIKAVEKLIVHCSASREDQDFDAAEIRRWHLRRGWFDIGYHYVIKRDGDVEKGRSDLHPGAHARGFNHLSLGICLVGGVESDGVTPEANFTHAQWDALEKLLFTLKGDYPDAEVLGHRDLPNVNKACPSFDVQAWWVTRDYIGEPNVTETKTTCTPEDG